MVFAIAIPISSTASLQGVGLAALVGIVLNLVGGDPFKEVEEQDKGV